MKVTYQSVEGTQEERPQELEIALSCVYLRKDIQRIPKEDSNGAIIFVWSYQEAQLTPEEYAEYVAEMDSPSVESIMQTISDIQAQQELQALDSEMNSEMVMQTLSDIQADIALLGI